MPVSKHIIDTSLGKVWITEFDSGDIAVWFPDRARVGASVADLMKGRGAWKPDRKNWIVPLRYSGAVQKEISAL